VNARGRNIDLSTFYYSTIYQATKNNQHLLGQ